MAKQVFDLRAGKGISTGESREHLRNYSVMNPDEKKNGYYDPTRVDLNFEVGKGGIIMPINKNYSIDQRFVDNLRNRGIEDPNKKKKEQGKMPNRNTVANIILGGSRDQMHRLAYGDQEVNLTRGADNSHIQRKEDIEKWAKDMYDFVSKQFGEDNIVAFIVHLDEKNPHVHCTVVPVNERNKISYHSVFGTDKEECRKKFDFLHDAVAAVNAKWGLKRGDDINITGAKHRTSEEYWQWLKKTCEDLEQKVGGRMEELKLLNREMQRTDIKTKGLAKMVENLNKNKADILQEIEDLKKQAANGKITQEQLDKEISARQSKLDDIEGILQDKTQKLRTAEQQLAEITRRRLEAEREYHALQRAINKDQTTLQDRTLRDISATGWDIATEETRKLQEKLNNFREDLNDEDRETFDAIFHGSIIEDMARAGNEIAAVATALSLGYVQQAVTFAENNGGGGGGPEGGWGKEPWEDDDKWRMRCFHMARAMMRPAKGRVVQRSGGFRR